MRLAMAQMAMTDKLTACWNRFRIEEVAQQELARSAPLTATSRAWRPFGFDVDVPRGACLSVELALLPQAAVEARTGLRGEMLLDRLELVRR